MKISTVLASIGALMASAQGATIYEIVRDSAAHNTLQAILDDANFADIKSAASGITLFAPDDTAFGNFLASNPSPLGLDATANATYISAVKEILLYHVIGSETANAATLTNDVYTATALGTSLRVANGEVNGITIDSANVAADDGLIHIIGEVIVPPPTLVTNVVDTAVLQTLEDVVTSPEQAAVLDVLTTIDLTDPVTVFAPTNDAFAAIEVPSDAAVVTQILQYHVVPALVFNETLPDGTYELDTLLGKKLTAVKANGVITLNDDITVVLADVNSKDGVAHAIDGVLIPPADEEEDEEAAASSVVPGFAASFVAACAYLMQ